MQLAQRKFEALLYNVTNHLRSLSRGLGLLEAQRLYSELSNIQDQVVDQGMTPVMIGSNVFELLRQGQALIEANREVIREWRREGMLA